MIVDYGTILTSLSGVIDLSKALIGERDAQKSAALKIELTERILKTQADLGQVLASVIEKDGTIRALTERVAELERNQTERARYQLAKLGTVGNVFAYRLRPAGELTERVDEPEHFLCQPCFDAGKKGVLMVSKYYAVCPLCRTQMQIETRPALTRRSSSPNW